MKKIQIINQDLDIDKVNPWNDDKLDRKRCADTLTKLLLTNTTPLTVSVNGEWGSGKTYLLKRWRQQLEREGYAAIYFNSWEDDSLDDPLVALLGQLWLFFGCKEYFSEIDSDKPIFKAWAKAGKKIDWKSVCENIAESITNINIKALREIDKTPEKKVLEKYLQGVRARETLRANIAKFAQSVWDLSQKPLVFIVDELDRCRPTFAIETLERIKHLFNIEHIIFVLGIDRKQLGISIKSVYGNIDSENYLHRFIDLDFIIPAADPMAFFDWQMTCGINQFFEDFCSSNSEMISFNKIFVRNIKSLIVDHKFTLREIEHFFIIWKFALNYNDFSQNEAILFAVLIVLKISNPSLYSSYVNGKISPKDVIDFLISKTSSMDLEDAVTIACVVYCSYLSNNSSSRNLFQEEIANLIEEIKQHNGITKSSICSECILRAAECGFFNENQSSPIFKFGIIRCVDRGVLRSLTQCIELGASCNI